MNLAMGLVYFLIFTARGASDIFHTFISLLSKVDLKSLSLTCRTLRNLVYDGLFSGEDPLFISANGTDLKYFEFIVQHPVLRLKVRKLVWDDSTFDERILNQTYWNNEESIHPAHRPCLHEARSLEELKKHGDKFEFWRDFVQDHLDNRSTREASVRLKRALRQDQLPNLESITLTTLLFRPDRLSKHYPALPPHSTSPAVRLFREKVGEQPFPLPHNRWNEDWLLTRHLPSLAEIPTAVSTAGAFDGVEAICEALAGVPGLFLTSFTILPQERHAESAPYDVHHSGLSHYFFLAWSSQMTTLKHTLRHVKQLTLSVGGSNTWYADQVIATHSSGHIGRLARAATGLENLWLDVDGMESPEMLFVSRSSPAGADSYDLETEPYFKQLSRLTLTNITLSTDYLLRVFRAYRRQLKYLRIEKCHLEGFWSHLLDELQTSSRFATLRKQLELHIDMVSDDDGGMLYARMVQRDSAESSFGSDSFAATRWIRGPGEYPLQRDASTPLPYLLE